MTSLEGVERLVIFEFCSLISELSAMWSEEEITDGNRHRDLHLFPLPERRVTDMHQPDDSQCIGRPSRLLSLDMA